MKPNIVHFSKETAIPGHNGTILAGPVLPERMVSPFGHAWGYLEDGAMMEGHSHEAEEVYMVFSGVGTLYFGEEKYPIKAGDIIELPSNVWHTVSSEKGKSLLFAAFWWPAK